MIAKMPDHELWMAFFRDSEGNLLALMSRSSLRTTGAGREHPENLRDRDPDVHQTQPADSAADIAVVPNRRATRDQKRCRSIDGEVIFGPGIGPRVDQQEQAEFETENNKQYRRQPFETSAGPPGAGSGSEASPPGRRSWAWRSNGGEHLHLPVPRRAANKTHAGAPVQN